MVIELNHPATDQWEAAFASLVGAQAELLRWYREVHGPAVRAGDFRSVESGYDERNAAISDARHRLVELPAADWQSLLIKIENFGFMTGCGTFDGQKEAIALICNDLIRLAERDGQKLEPASFNPNLGPDYTGLRTSLP